MQAVTTILEAIAFAIILTAAALVWVPAQYAVPAMMVGDALALLLASWGLSRPPKAADRP